MSVSGGVAGESGLGRFQEGVPAAAPRLGAWIPSRQAWAGLLPWLLLAALVAGAFHGALAGRLFYLRDVSQNHLPMRALVTERLTSGALPLWDPLHGGGTPLLANPNHLVLHPITALFFVLPVQEAFTASILLQFLLLAWGGYLLARSLGLQRAPATLAAAVLSLSGPFASLASMQNVLSAIAWVPLLLWALLRFADGGLRRHCVAAALLASVVLATGEAASIVALLLLAPALLPDSGGSGREATGFERAGLLLGRLTAPLLAGVVLAAIQILPAIELLGISSRAGGLAAAEAQRWPLLPQRLAEVVLPRLFGDPTRLSPERWWGTFLFEGGYPFLLSVYVGAVPVLLAILALGRGVMRRRAVALTAAGSLMLLLGLLGASGWWRALLAPVPVLSQVRYPERFLLGAVFALGLLAAIGLDRLMRLRQGSRAVLVMAVAAGLLFAGATAMVARPTSLDPILQGSLNLPAAILATEAGAVIRGSLLHSLLWAFAEVAVAAAAAAWLTRGRWSSSGAATWVIVLVCCVSMTVAAAPARSTAAPGWMSAPSPLAERVDHETAGRRLYHAPRPARLSVWGRTDEQIWGYRFDRFTYSLLTGHEAGVPTILDAATDRMDLGLNAGLGTALPDLTLDQRVRILRICHAGFVLGYEALEHHDLFPLITLDGLSQPAAHLFAVRQPLERVRFVASARAAAWPGDPVASLSDPAFDPDREVLLDEPFETAPGLEAQGPAEVRVLQDAPEQVRIALSAPTRGYLVVTDAHAPGWRATLDGHPIPLLRANGLFRAVAVPRGRHEVEMTYRPSSLLAGAGISAMGAVVLALYATRRRATAA